mgnify:FL=1
MQEPLQPQEIRNNRAQELYEWVESALFAVIVMLTIFTFFVRPATVDGSSMVPTLHNAERLVLQQIGYTDPQYGDIVVVDRSQSEEPPIVKRVIGKGGDTIYINFETHEVWRNDELLDEPYINEPTTNQFDIQFPVEVPQGSIFVMGDNRNHSLDSRSSEIGMVDLRCVMGKAIYRFFPFNKIGGIS